MCDNQIFLPRLSSLRTNLTNISNDTTNRVNKSGIISKTMEQILLINQLLTEKVNNFNTSALRLLALRGLHTLRVRRVALRAPGLFNLNYFWIFFLYIYIVNKGLGIIFDMDPKIRYSRSTPLKTPCQPLKASF